MCGAYSQFTDEKKLAKRFGVTVPALPKRYNIRPSQPVAVIFNDNPGELSFALWGIYPPYDKPQKMFLINARSDSLGKPMWKKLLVEHRCLILADGFYEWYKPEDGGPKVPFRFELKTREPFAFAGLWQEVEGKDGKPERHCVIITTEPNELVGKIHNRMPAILDPEDEAKWLNPDLETTQLLELLKPYNFIAMESFSVSTKVNSPAYDSRDLIRQI